MIVIAILIGCILGAIIGINAPVIPYTYSTFLAIAVVAALDSVFGGITSVLKKNFDLTIFISGFFCNSLLSIALTYLGQKLNLDIYLAALVVFVGRIEKIITKLLQNISKMLQKYFKNISNCIDICRKM